MKTCEVLFMNHYGQEHFEDIFGEKCWQVFQANQTGPCAFCTNDKLLDGDGQPAGT